MTRIAEHPLQTNRPAIKDQEVTTTTTTMEQLDLIDIDATLHRLKKPGLLAKQSFYVSATSPGFITPMACPSAQQPTRQKFFWQGPPDRIKQFHIVSKVTETEAGCLGDAIEIVFLWPLSRKSSDPEPTSSLGEGFVVEGGQQAPAWLREAEEALQRLLTLPKNWDSYGGRRVQPDIARSARELLRGIAHLDIPRPHVMPTSRGGIQLEWHTHGIDLEIEIRSLGQVHISYENPQENTAMDFDLGPDLKPLAELIAKLSNPRWQPDAADGNVRDECRV